MFYIGMSYRIVYCTILVTPTITRGNFAITSIIGLCCCLECLMVYANYAESITFYDSEIIDFIMLPLPMLNFHTIAEPRITDLFIERNVFI
jgi:hypothetical protein